MEGPCHGKVWGRTRLQPLGALELAEVLVEGPQGEMAGFACDLEDEAVGESQRRPFAILIQRGDDDIGIFNRDHLVIEEHFDRSCDLAVIEVVCSAQQPRTLDKYKVRDPRSAGEPCPSWTSACPPDATAFCFGDGTKCPIRLRVVLPTFYTCT